MVKGEFVVDLVIKTLGNSAESDTTGELVQSGLGGAPLVFTGAGGEDDKDKSGENEDVEMVEDRFEREKPLMSEERLVVSVCSLFEPGCELKRERMESR